MRVLVDGLEVIKEVSEHDCSLTMSLKSIRSEVVEEEGERFLFDPLGEKENMFGGENSGGRDSGDCQIGNYHEAL